MSKYSYNKKARPVERAELSLVRDDVIGFLVETLEYLDETFYLTIG